MELNPVNCGCSGVGKIQTDHDTVVPGEPIDGKPTERSKNEPRKHK